MALLLGLLLLVSSTDRLVGAGNISSASPDGTVMTERGPPPTLVGVPAVDDDPEDDDDKRATTSSKSWETDLRKCDLFQGTLDGVMICRLVPLDKGDRRRLLLLVAPLLVVWLPVVAEVVPPLVRPLLLLPGGDRRLVPREYWRDVVGGDSAGRLGDLRNTLCRCCCCSIVENVVCSR
jgi:hypothetical protein